MNPADISTAGTRERLLAAAAETFAEHGYRGATIREICRRARANVAAVNYHFRDKAGLYEEVVRDAERRATDRYPLHPAEQPASPEERLRLFVRQFLARIFDPGVRSQHGRLMLREMVDPSPALDRLVQEAFRPQFLLLQDTMRTLLGPAATDDEVRLCALSVVGQCVFYNQCRPVLERMFPDMVFGPELIERLSQHVTAVSLGGLRALREADARRKAS
jgi:AcrR family transcriptional regulator